jgi:hypothetical protein
VITIGILLALIIAPLAQQIIAVPSTEELSAPEFGPFAPTLDFVRYFVESLSTFNPFGDDQILGKLFFGVVILGCVRGLWRSESRRSTLWLAAWWLLPFLTNLITLNFVPAAQVRYYLFTLPAYLQLGLYGLMALIEACFLLLRWTPLRSALQRPGLTIGLPFLVLALAIPRLTEVTQGLTRLANDQAWTRVAAYLRTEVRPGDIVLCEVYELTGGDEDKCRWQLNEFEGLTQTSPVLYFNALAGYRQAEQQRELLQQPGRAWFVLYFRQPPGEKEITFEESSGLTAKKFGRTWVLQVDSADTLLKNIIACGEWLLRTLPDDDHQFRYNLDLAQLYALAGEQETANQHVEQAFQIQQTSNEPARLPELRTVAAMVRFYAPARPAPQHALEVNFDNRLKLRGYSLEPELFSPGAETQASLSLYWQVLAPLEKDYSVFVHLRDAGGKVVGHLDFQPYDAIYPTFYWPVGAELREARPLALPQELPPGHYTLVIGLYLPDDLSRLRIVEDTGGENAVTLGTLTIQGS